MLNNLKRNILFFSCFVCSTLGFSQTTITGTVSERSSRGQLNALTGANVFLLNTFEGVSTDESGNFSIPVKSSLPVQLVVSFVGYLNDTLEIIDTGVPLKIILENSVDMDEVQIQGRRSTTEISTIKPINVENVGTGELMKAACCNLSESFETNPSVNVSYSDAVSGAKEIQMLGLSGIYSQIMTENIPNLKGLAAPYGLAFIPGPWMESIQITKGSGSVANGFESTTGQINIEFLKPHKADPTYLNLYAGSMGRFELNAHQKINVSKKVNGLLFIHGETIDNENDRQNDGFRDVPRTRAASLYNRWYFNNGRNIEGQIGVRALYDSRLGGQFGFDDEKEPDSQEKYGVKIINKRLEVYTKTGLLFPEKPWKSMGLITQGAFHDLNSLFGLNTFEGRQDNVYASVILMSIIGSTDHKYKTGIDFRYDKFNQQYNNLEIPKEEIVPGAYIEYTYNWNEKFGAVAGVRADHHQDYDWNIIPRIHMKYNFTPEFIIRASAGKSFRTPNVISDNLFVLASSRNLLVMEELKPEEAWNFGMNATKRFRLDYREGSISVDYYVTNFDNQLIADRYSSNDNILLYNLNGESFANSFQIAVNYELIKRLDIRMAWKIDDVKVTYSDKLERKPLVPEHRGLLNVAYATKKDKWMFDLTILYEGDKQLAVSRNTLYNDSQVSDNISPDFVTLNAQVTYTINSWQVYLGAENLADFTQKNVILGANDPFGKDFDATNTWGPIIGRNIYLGLRLTINNKKKDKI